MPLEDFSPEQREEFARIAALPQPPPPAQRTIRLNYGQISSRATYEWYAARGLDPQKRRQKIAAWMRAAVLERDGMVCQLCGGEIPDGDLHLDHVEPLSHGGATTPANLQAAHSRCNIAKGATCDA